MDFTLGADQRMVKETVRKFASNEIAPYDAQMDREGEINRTVLERLREHNIWGLVGPAEYGGGGADHVGMIICVEELARASASIAITLDAHWLCLKGIEQYGSPAQRERYLSDLCSGKSLGAFAWTEPSAGSDAASIETRAEKTGGAFIINGTKCFCTNGDLAGTYLVGAVTDPASEPKHISMFIIERGTKGFRVGRREDKMGLRGSHTTELILENVRVKPSQLLGGMGEGFKTAMNILNIGRLIVGGICVGTASAALEASAAYAKKRRAFGKPLSEQQAVQFMIADMDTGINAARLLVLDAASRASRGETFYKEAAQAKYFASEMVMEACRNAVQIHGGYGFTRNFPVERYYRNAKFTEIGEGTSEVLRMLIARALLT